MRKYVCYLPFVLLLFPYFLLRGNIHFLYLTFLFLLYHQSIEDLRTMELSTWSMRLLGVNALGIIIMEQKPLDFVICGMLSVSVVFFLMYVGTRGKGIGGADVKFMLFCGGILGFQGAYLALLYACLWALLFHVCTAFQVARMPFIPFLSLGVYLVLL